MCGFLERVSGAGPELQWPQRPVNGRDLLLPSSDSARAGQEALSEAAFRGGGLATEVTRPGTWVTAEVVGDGCSAAPLVLQRGCPSAACVQ